MWIFLGKPNEHVKYSIHVLLAQSSVLSVSCYILLQHLQCISLWTQADEGKLTFGHDIVTDAQWQY